MADLLFLPAVLVVLFLPGAVWLHAIRPGKMDSLERIAETAGASLALTGLIALYFNLAGVQVSAAGLVGLYGTVALAGIILVLRRGWHFSISGWTLLAVGGVVGLVAWRLYQVHGLALPVWVDPVHHVLLVRKIYEYGGLPMDWQPYLQVPLFYHYGFHVLAAAFTFWSRMSPAQAVLLFGQVVNAMVALSVYRLAKALWGDRLRAGLAGLLTAFGFHMPAYYLSWGRYPLLAGLIVLPLAMAAALEVRRSPWDRAAWARLVLFSAAVCFCHFLTVGLLVLFLLVLAGAEAIRALQKKSLNGIVWQPFLFSAFGAMAASPWLWRVWSYTRQMFSVEVPDPIHTAANSSGIWDYFVYLTGPDRSHFLLGLAAVGLIFGLIQGRARLVAIWGLLIALLATPYGPRFDPFRPDHLAIVLFLPGSLLLAELMVAAGDWIERLAAALRDRFSIHSTSTVPPSGISLEVDPQTPGADPLPVSPAVVPPVASRRRWRLAVVLPLIASLIISAWGIWQTRDIVNPVTVLADTNDVTAIDWLAQNTPVDARFFINTTGWMGPIYRGTDGGYWIMTLTGRFTVAPPAAYGWGAKEDILRYSDWSKRASEVKACDDSFWSLVRDAQLTYAYLHKGSGSLQPETMEGCAGVDKVYEQGGVFIYRLSP